MAADEDPLQRRWAFGIARRDGPVALKPLLHELELLGGHERRYRIYFHCSGATLSRETDRTRAICCTIFELGSSAPACLPRRSGPGARTLGRVAPAVPVRSRISRKCVGRDPQACGCRRQPPLPERPLAAPHDLAPIPFRHTRSLPRGGARTGERTLVAPGLRMSATERAPSVQRDRHLTAVDGVASREQRVGARVGVREPHRPAAGEL